MPVQHLDKEISVTLSEGDIRLPQRFKLAGRDYQVAEVLTTWQDHGYSGLSASRRDWQGGNECQYYRLRTADGETFEVYLEIPARGKSWAQKGRWYASRRITAAAAEQGVDAPQTRLET